MTPSAMAIFSILRKPFFVSKVDAEVAKALDAARARIIALQVFLLATVQFRGVTVQFISGKEHTQDECFFRPRDLI